MRSRTRPMSLRASSAGAGVAVERVDVDAGVEDLVDGPRPCAWRA